MVVHDDGSGRELYLGGAFSQAGGQYVFHVAKWNGQRWSALGSGIDGSVNAMTTCDSGLPEGAVLYAGGNFLTAGTTPARSIAKWNGASWSALPGTFNAAVLSMGTFSPPGTLHQHLVVSGSFSNNGALSLSRIATWTGTAWSAMGAGLNEFATSMVEFDDGSGNALFVGGFFTSAGGQPASHVARWNGSIWSAVGIGLPATVSDLAVFDDGLGGGPALLAATSATSSGSALARWTGSSWVAFGDGTEASVSHLMVRRSPGAPDVLYATGGFSLPSGLTAFRVQRWTGSGWTPVGTGNTAGTSLIDYDDGTGNGAELHVAYNFGDADGLTTNHIAKWDGARWLPLGNGFTGGASGGVRSLCVFPQGSAAGGSLYAAGLFQSVDGVAVRNVARWNGTTWDAVAGGLTTTVEAMAVYAPGGVGNSYLYALGQNSLTPAPLPPSSMARWDGTSWAAVLPAPQGATRMVVHDDGSGVALYVNSGPPQVPGNQGLARWNGTIWSGVGGGLNGFVTSLAVFDDRSGHGEQLYVSGAFTMAGTTAVSRIAKWDGTSWSGLSSGLNAQADAMVVHDDLQGSGPALYVGGGFSLAGGQTCKGLAKWDGSSWTPVGTSVPASILRLYSHAESPGTAPTLFAFGGFAITPLDVIRFAKWTGTTWIPVGGDVSGSVMSLASFDDGHGEGPALFVGGNMVVNDSQDGWLGKYGCVWSPATELVCRGDGSGSSCPCGNTGASDHGCASSLDGAGAQLVTSGVSRLSQDSLTLIGSNVTGSCVLFFQGTQLLNSGTGFPFGDGLRCVGGNVVRLGMQAMVPTLVFYPTSTDVSVSAKGGLTSPGVRYYQMWFRDLGALCGAGSFNLSNACQVTWAP